MWEDVFLLNKCAKFLWKSVVFSQILFKKNPTNKQLNFYRNEPEWKKKSKLKKTFVWLIYENICKDTSGHSNMIYPSANPILLLLLKEVTEHENLSSAESHKKNAQ